MSARSNRKGRVFERRVAALFRASGIEADRVLTECREGNLGDVALDPRIPLVIQAKCGARPPVWQALKEAKEAAGPGVIPVAILHRDGTGGRAAEEVAVLPLGAFVDLVALLVSTGGWG